MKKFLLVAALAGVFASCNSNKSNKQTQTASPENSSSLQNAPTPSTTTQSGLLTNPAHGQPGHDCALPVGAPLNQKVAAPQAPTAPTVSASQTVPTQPSSSQKVNPAHGQPGHDCAKPVGAPLS